MKPLATIKDQLQWLENKQSKEVASFIINEQRKTDTALERSSDLRETIAQEIIDRLEMNRTTPPAEFNGYRYYLRDVEAKPFPIYCRSFDDQEEILLDANHLEAMDSSLQNQFPADLQTMELCPDQRFWAIAIDWAGNERYQIWIKDLEKGTFIGCTENEMAPQIAWINSFQFIALTLNDRNRPYQATHITLDNNTSGKLTGESIFEENNETLSLSIRRSASGDYVFLTVSLLRDSSEILLLKTSEHQQPVFRNFLKRKTGIRYQITHHGDYFYLISDDTGANKRLYRLPIGANPSTNKEVIYDCTPEIELHRLQAFKDFLVLYQRNGLQTEIEIINPYTLEKRKIDFPEPSYSIAYADNLMYESAVCYFYYSSLTSPDLLYGYDTTQGKLFIARQTEINHYQKENYQSELLHVPGNDGVKIPVSLVYRKDLKNARGNPLVLYGYGAYGYGIPVEFSSLRISLIDRGIIYAIAHTRGGGELGPEWHEQGKFLNKYNSIHDFISCANFLKKEGYTTTDQLAVMGESAGGLLVAAAINQYPDLCAVMVAINPFLDVFGTLSNPDLPGTPEEWVEWGNPANPEERPYILSYSPLENIKRAKYPAMLLTCSLHDAQVPYWEACKYKLRMSEINGSEQEALLIIHKHHGHKGSNHRYDLIEEEAQLYAYLISKLSGS